MREPLIPDKFDGFLKDLAAENLPEITDPENIFHGISARLQKRNQRKKNVQTAFLAGVTGLLLIFTGFNLHSMLTSGNRNTGEQTPEEYAREFYIDRINGGAFFALFTEPGDKQASTRDKESQEQHTEMP
ncbi:MAG TPA: hypothetical protein ENN63_08845 [Bacteroidetes bacterium]|nr:hypothetical protein [Bacteroidota bacterium]